MEAPQDLHQNPDQAAQLAEQLALVIELEACNKKPERISQVISEYEATKSFLELMKNFPAELASILDGQQTVREETATYEIKPGIVAFQKMPYQHHRVDVLEFVKEVMEAVYRYTEGYTEINIGILKRFLFEYDRAIAKQEEERSTEDLILIKLVALHEVNEDILTSMRRYITQDKQVKEMQRTSTFARQEEARAFTSWQRDRFQEGEF
jgi:hypothetical protein